MTAPRHHVPDALLTAYASGAAPEAVALFVAVHASLCPACAVRIADEEAVGGALLAAAARVAPSPSLRARVLAELGAPSPPSPPSPSPHPLFPSPLLAYTGAAPAWKRVAPGLETAPLPLALGEQPVVLARFAPGSAAPRHGHAGLELQLVLAGGYAADEGHFGRGDAHCVDAGEAHGFRVDEDGPCVALLVRERRIVARGARARLFAWLTGA